ncbi:MAG: hypothetical protein GKR95_20860 [Gammaproteobacteria bacterium]|nr:hypothetical protein [Gammaproteobacteria bacterium]
MINPKDQDLVEAYLMSTDLESAGLGFEFAYQSQATGMLDAILAPMEQLIKRSGDTRVDQLWITWCDQVGITDQTAKTMHDLFDGAKEPSLIFPTIEKPDPYIHMQRNPAGEIVRVMHKREGDNMPAVGENDCGLFGLSHSTYFKLLRRFSDFLDAPSSVDNSNQGLTIGASTQERNFLPFISWMRGKGTVSTYRAVDDMESIGINTIADAQVLAAKLVS